MGGRRDEAISILKTMLGPQMAAELGTPATHASFAGRIGEMALESVFEPLWTSEALDRKTRSLVTIAMLIALRATEELRVHFPAAIRNGASIAELEEVIYQATGYAGFPAAHSARVVAIEALSKAGMIG
jgi:4-carboxymuconolactone decarboxylase